MDFRARRLRLGLEDVLARFGTTEVGPVDSKYLPGTYPCCNHCPAGCYDIHLGTCPEDCEMEAYDV